MPENTLCELIREFWLPLVNEVKVQQSRIGDFKLYIFLVDYEGCVGTWEVPFVEKLNANWEPPSPLKSPMITEFSDDDLMNWIENEYDNLPTIITDQVDDVVEAILTNSDNGIPELALEIICDRCGYDWYEESEKWLKL